MNHAHRITPCPCAVCKADRFWRNVGRGVLYGFAAVGVLVAGWALFVILWTLRP